MNLSPAEEALWELQNPRIDNKLQYQINLVFNHILTKKDWRVKVPFKKKLMTVECNRCKNQTSPRMYKGYGYIPICFDCENEDRRKRARSYAQRVRKKS